MVSKFPPIEGGISAKTYWLACGFAEAGMEVHVVTNAMCVENDYRIRSCENDFHLPPGVEIDNVQVDTPWHIPYSELYLEKLLDKALSVCRAFNIEVIDSHYLIPYGVTAYLASQITKIPYIIRHGGSDVAKFWDRGFLGELLHQTLTGAATLITEKPELAPMNTRTIRLPQYVPDEHLFKPVAKNGRHARYAYIGKINYHWEHKSLDRMLSLWNKVSSKEPLAELVFLCQGKGKEDFIKKREPQNIKFVDFISPWEMPGFLQDIDYLFYLVDNNPISDFSNLVVEAVACGVKIITDNIRVFDCYKPFFDPSKYLLDIDNFKLFQKSDEINIGSSSKQAHLLRTIFNDYIKENIYLYQIVAEQS